MFVLLHILDVFLYIYYCFLSAWTFAVCMCLCENVCLCCWLSILVSDGGADNIFWRSARPESSLTFLPFLARQVSVRVCVCVCVRVCVCSWLRLENSGWFSLFPFSDSTFSIPSSSPTLFIQSFFYMFLLLFSRTYVLSSLDPSLFT